VTLRVNNREATFSYVLLDTGSASTVFKTEHLFDMGVELGLTDTIRQILGVGGTEWVIDKQVEAVILDEMLIQPMMIELGELNYGFPLDGILGLDFLRGVKAVIDFDQLTITQKS
jgi:hypothetical protein